MISSIQLKYYAWDISHKKSVSDDSRFTGVLSEARVDLNPHQVEAALFAFKSPLSKGAILADEVGLGKTIEAGIILSEMWAENKRKILIIVPASLRNQWNIELMEKFYLPSFILESNSMDDAKSQIIRGKQQIFICSYNFASTNADFLKTRKWDLIVFDEAHKLRNVYKKGNVMANVIRASFQNYKKVLLTATPLQNNLKELYGLISIIDPQFFLSLDTFAEQYNAVSTRDAAKYGELKGRISHIIHRTLRNQVEEYVNFTKRTAFVQEYYPSEAEMKLYESVSNYLMREGTYGIPERQRPPLSLLVRKILIPLQKEVMELSREHDALRRQIRKEHNATIKLQLKKEEMQMSRNLNQKRARMYALEDEYKDKVDEMTEKLQKEVNIKIHSEVMFRFKWHII